MKLGKPAENQVWHVIKQSSPEKANLQKIRCDPLSSSPVITSLEKATCTKLGDTLANESREVTRWHLSVAGLKFCERHRSSTLGICFFSEANTNHPKWLFKRSTFSSGIITQVISHSSCDWIVKFTRGCQCLPTHVSIRSIFLFVSHSLNQVLFAERLGYWIRNRLTDLKEPLYSKWSLTYSISQ